MRRSRPKAAVAVTALLLVDADGEALPPLATPVREDLGASAGRHPGEKAVRTKAARVVGLIGAFRLCHDGIPLKGRGKYTQRRKSQARVRGSVFPIPCEPETDGLLPYFFRPISQFPRVRAAVARAAPRKGSSSATEDVPSRSARGARRPR